MNGLAEGNCSSSDASDGTDDCALVLSACDTLDLAGDNGRVALLDDISAENARASGYFFISML